MERTVTDLDNAPMSKSIQVNATNATGVADADERYSLWMYVTSSSSTASTIVPLMP